ncbi:unnamed protein product [Oreochromis niloticus]|nr:unnamed protein product [Mustela putorius furo]
MRVNVKLQHSWSQIFTGETITLRCEIQGGEGKVWKYEWTAPNTNSPPTSSEYRISRVSVSHSGDYRCRGSSDYLLTGWSDAFTLTVSSSKPRATLTAQSSVLPAGGSVTLSCSVEGSAGWKFDWFRRDSQFSGAQKIGAGTSEHTISISEGGIYYCRGGRGDPVFSTEDSSDVTVKETLTVSGADSSSSPVWLIVGLVCGVSLIIILLLLLYRCRTTNSAANEQTLNQDEDQQQVYSSLLRVPSKPTVTLQPSWTQIYSGETVTVRCEIQGGEGAQWTMGHSLLCLLGLFLLSTVIHGNTEELGVKATVTADRLTIPAGGSVTLTCDVKHSADFEYGWFREPRFDSNQKTAVADESKRELVTSEGGIYACRGRIKGKNSITEESDSVIIQETGHGVNITVTADSTTIPAGGSVTLTCDVKHSADLKYEWVRETSSAVKSTEAVGSDKVIRISKGGKYQCRGWRTDTTSLIAQSDPVTIQETGMYYRCEQHVCFLYILQLLGDQTSVLVLVTQSW